MKLCKIGIHDWETVRETDDIATYIGQILADKGFKYNEDNVVFKDTEYGVLRINVFFSIWRKVFPNTVYDPYRKVCLSCGKVRQNYTLDKIENKIDEVIDNRYLLLQRQYEAKKRLNETV